MKIVSVLILGLALAIAMPLNDEIEWQNFKRLHQKTYETPEKEARRFEIFKENLKTIRENNEKFQNGEISFLMGINEFSDMTPEEFQAFVAKGILGMSARTDEEEWQKFKKLNHKYYETDEEEIRRFEIFIENLKVIQENNERFQNGETSFRMGVNQFSDMTPEEIQAFLGKGILRMSPRTEEEEWQKFKKLHHKYYETQEEEARRFKIFRANLKTIQEHNEKFEKGEATYKIGVNKFSDLTPEEFKAIYGRGILLSDIEEWHKFKNDHHKLYQSPDEESRRFEIFKENFKTIREHNEKFARGETTFEMRVNKFTDLTPEEFKAIYGRGVLPPKDEDNKPVYS